MPSEIINATILFTVALLLYSTAIWSERLAQQLKKWHVAVFFCGVLTDALATWITIDFIGAIVLTPHAIFGFTSLFLMVLHFVWAVIVLFSSNKQTLELFHKFGLFVWSIWMLSYLTGFISGIQKVL